MKYVIGHTYNGWVLLDRRSQMHNNYRRAVYTVRCRKCSEVRDICHFGKMCDCKKSTKRIESSQRDVQRLLSEGLSSGEIAKLYNVSRMSVYRVCDTHRIPRKRNGGLTADIVKQMTAEGLNIKEIAAKVGYSYGYTQAFCRANNIKYIGLGRGGRKWRFGEGDTERLKQLWETYKDYQKVADELGCSKSAVRNNLIRLQIVPASRRYCKDGELGAVDLADVPQLLSRHELAKLLRVSYKWVTYNACNIVGAVRVGKRWRFRLGAVKRALDAGDNVVRPRV